LANNKKLKREAASQPLIAAADDCGSGSNSNSAESPAQAESRGAVTVHVTVENANAMAIAGEEFITTCADDRVCLDMHNVEATSVAVAVALAWLAAANHCNKELRLSNLSSDFSGVIEFSGVTSMFDKHTV